MNNHKTVSYLRSLLKELVSMPVESEWVEFKLDNDNPKMIGEYISAMSNSAALVGKQSAYIVWGVNDEDHKVEGTRFRPSAARYKKQELESWLLQKTKPKINFYFYEFTSFDELPVVILEIQAATHSPVQFEGVEFIRVGSYKKKLREFPEKERQLWRAFDRVPFERQVARENVSAESVLKLLDYPAYFNLTDFPLPANRDGILAALQSERLIIRSDSGHWHISNLGAILFSKNLDDFDSIRRKAVRLILYKAENKLETVRELTSSAGYASGFEDVMEKLKTLVPVNEHIGRAFRVETPMYPELTLRELVANAIIHQDFNLTGTGPMIELFASRLEITNPGIPLVDTQRFLDNPPQSRNEALASFMRRIGICEERGSGIDKVISEIESNQLPPPKFEQTEKHTRVVLFAQKDYKKMDFEDRIRAAYQHCCLKYVNRDPMNNTSLRERLNIEKRNSAVASRIIKNTVDAGLIRLHDGNSNRKSYRYVPFWVQD